MCFDQCRMPNDEYMDDYKYNFLQSHFLALHYLINRSIIIYLCIITLAAMCTKALTVPINSAFSNNLS